MSVETIAIVISAATLLVAFGSGFGCVIHRIDARVDRVERGLEHRLGERIDRVEHVLGERLDRVEHELVEVKIAVARIEGPPCHLLTAR